MRDGATSRARRAGQPLVPVTCLLAVTVAGCPPPRRGPIVPTEPPPEPASLDTIVERYNANADRMPPTALLLTRRVSVQAGYVDDDGKLQEFEGEGELNFVKPGYFYLELKHGMFGTPLAELGSDGRRYWMWYEKQNKLWWGKHEHLDKQEIRDMPIRPDQLVSSLGLTRLPASSPELSGPVLRVDSRPSRNAVYPNYRLIYYWKNGGRFEREYGLRPVPPYLADWIVFGDKFGRNAYEAILADFSAVGVRDGVVKGDPPLMPHQITLRMSNRSFLNMRIQQPHIKALTSRLNPPDRWRAMRSPAGCEVIQIDEVYDRPTTRSSDDRATKPSSSAPAS